jgi:hypothetical protein
MLLITPYTGTMYSRNSASIDQLRDKGPPRTGGGGTGRYMYEYPDLMIMTNRLPYFVPCTSHVE